MPSKQYFVIDTGRENRNGETISQVVTEKELAEIIENKPDSGEHYELSENQFNFWVDATDQGLDVDFWYSGRGMYGKYCPAVTVDSMSEFNTEAKTLWDNMGRSFVVYARN